MLDTQPTTAALPRQHPLPHLQPAEPAEPFRWPRADVATILADFWAADQQSQRHYAAEIGIPQSTFNYWLRHHSAVEDDPVDVFFRSPAGEVLLRRIVLSAITTFQLEGACGIRPIGTFLDRAGLDRFVATSRGALHPLTAHLEEDLVAFRDSEQPALAQQMKFKTVTLVPDENFHNGRPCLVAVEPVAGFILVECYRDRRDADTWQEAITEGIRGMDIEIVQMTSDQAKALICCAEKGFEAAYCPELFHGQQDILKPMLLPLTRPIQQAEKDLEKATRQVDQLDTPLEQPQSEQQWTTLFEAVSEQRSISEELKQARELHARAVQSVRGIGDDYHPFDRNTGHDVTAEEVGKRLNDHLDQLQEVVEQAELGSKAYQAVNKARTWVATLMGCVAWFWSLAQKRVEALQLTEEQEKIVYEKLLGGCYWGMAAGRARTAEERTRLREMAEKLTQQAWQADGALGSLSEERKEHLQRVAQEIAGLFQRSSSCVEGRNGRLSLQHHGHSRVSERRLKALTVLHNYMAKRPDGTTAAQRFFGQQHQDVFSWLLERMPDLPRPAAKRPKQVGLPTPQAG